MENAALEKIKQLVSEHGSQQKVAATLGITPSYLHDILKEKRAISEAVAEKLGFKRTITFVSANQRSQDNKRWYVLSDGHDTDQRRQMTEEEYEEANRKANEATDGNWGWYPDDPAQSLPAVSKAGGL